MGKIKFILAFLLLLPVLVTAQELKCTVTVNSDQISGTNKSVFESLQTAVYEFMNNRQFTDYQYDEKERIECSLYIIVNKYTDNFFTAEIQVQATRPVYGSNYKSPIFAYNDKQFGFSYAEGNPLTFDISTFGDNLTEVLAYYAYIIIGTDCDSFSKLGGTKFFNMAEQIVNQAQSTSEAGWKAFEDNHNRYALITNILDEVSRPYREYFYTYHRLALDNMYKSADKSRATIIEGMPVLKDCYKARPSMIIINEFTDAKFDEIINIMSKGSKEERQTAYDILSYIAPTEQERLGNLK